MDLKLGDVQGTALIPLAVRASESRRKNARIQDPKAVEIMEKLQIDPKNLDRLITHECVVARSILFDSTVKKLISRYPNALCLNLGCGLDDRFSRMDNGTIDWYNIDLPDSIDVRRRVFGEREREHALSKDIMDENCFQDFPKDRPVIAVAEGLFMYFSREQISSVLRSLQKGFPKGFLAAELMRQRSMNKKRHDTLRYSKAEFGWGCEDGRELESMNPAFRLLTETNFSDEMQRSTFLSRLIGTLLRKYNNRLALYQWGEE